MSDLSEKSVSELRQAARAWRDHQAARKTFWRPDNTSLHDRIDDLITEIERLRNAQP